MKFFRLNQQIQARELRVLDDKGEQIGLLTRDEALEKARELGVDVVEIAPLAVPPVAKLIDFKKFRYMEEKKQRESKRNAKTSDMKELRLGPFMSDNDFNTRLVRGKEFLGEGHKLRLVLKFSGRQITHPEFGWDKLNKMVAALETFGRVERQPKLEGKMIVATLTPSKKGTDDKAENA